MKSGHPISFSGTLGGYALASAFAATVVSAPAYGVPIFFKSNVPDFYQHQKAGSNANKPLDNFNPLAPDDHIRFNNAAPRPANPPGVPSYDTNPANNWWEHGGGFCCVAAFVNSFYFLEKTHGFTGLFTRADREAAFIAANGRAPTWQEQMVFAIEDLARDMGFSEIRPVNDQGGPSYPPAKATGERIPQHVRKLEAGKRTPLSYTEFDVTAGFGTATPTVSRRVANAAGDAFSPDAAVAETIFDLYRKELCRSEDVTILIQFPKDRGPADGSRPWWAQPRAEEPNQPDGSFFHVVTGAGVENCSETTGSGRIYVADPDKRNQQAGNAFPGPNDVRERYPYDATLLLPLPASGATEAQMQAFYDEFTLDANGCITASASTPAYVGACVGLLTAISPTSEPATLALLAVGLALIGAGSRRRRNDKRNDRRP